MQAVCGNSFWADVPLKICQQERVKSCFSVYELLMTHETLCPLTL